MKTGKKAHMELIRNMRKTLPCFNDGRVVRYLSEYSKEGQIILAKASKYEGECLGQVYSSWSDEKQEEYDKLWKRYCEDKSASVFGICCASGWFFTISWVTQNQVLYFTPNVEYVVICDE